MIFAGVDLGWVCNPSGLAALRWDGDCLRLTRLAIRESIDGVLTWLDEEAGAGPAIVAVDAPLVIPNTTGMRLADKLTHSLYGRYHAGCYPANLTRPFAHRTTAFSAALSHRGFAHGCAIQPRSACRQQIEVFPHITAVELFDLERIFKYKKGALADRARGLAALRELLLQRLPLLSPALLHFDLPPIPRRGLELKALEDQLDALLCAYMAAHWWYWGLARNHVLGNVDDGYIVVPSYREMNTSAAPARKLSRSM